MDAEPHTKQIQHEKYEEKELPSERELEIEERPTKLPTTKSSHFKILYLHTYLLGCRHGRLTRKPKIKSSWTENKPGIMTLKKSKKDHQEIQESKPTQYPLLTSHTTRHSE